MQLVQSFQLPVSQTLTKDGFKPATLSAANILIQHPKWIVEQATASKLPFSWKYFIENESEISHDLEKLSNHFPLVTTAPNETCEILAQRCTVLQHFRWVSKIYQKNDAKLSGFLEPTQPAFTQHPGTHTIGLCWVRPGTPLSQLGVVSFRGGRGNHQYCTIICIVFFLLLVPSPK